MSESDQPPQAQAAQTKDKRSRDPEQWVHRSMAKYRAGGYQLEFRPGETFFELADAVVEPKRTLLGYNRLYVFWQAVGNLIDVPGSVVEVGAYRGGSAHFIASAFERLTGTEVPIHVFDTFEGHPGQALSQHDPFHTEGQFSSTSYDEVRNYLVRFARLQVHKGDILDALPTLPDDVYRLVHVDTDLYKPTLACLDYFGPRMSTGGVVVIDDYASDKCPGVPKAVSEYVSRSDLFRAWDMRTEQLILVKR